MYYVLLDAGFRLVPTAGTASGVHPVPVGFSRVYVHLPDGFSYAGWLAGLQAGRSFVTTGPMLLATANGRPAGETLAQRSVPAPVQVAGTVLSEHPLALVEVVANGQPVRTVMPQNKLTPAGSRETTFSTEVTLDTSGWLCVRAFEDRPDGRVAIAPTRRRGGWTSVTGPCNRAARSRTTWSAVCGTKSRAVATSFRRRRWPNTKRRWLASNG